MQTRQLKIANKQILMELERNLEDRLAYPKPYESTSQLGNLLELVKAELYSRGKSWEEAKEIGTVYRELWFWRREHGINRGDSNYAGPGKQPKLTKKLKKLIQRADGHALAEIRHFLIQRAERVRASCGTADLFWNERGELMRLVQAEQEWRKMRTREKRQVDPKRLKRENKLWDWASEINAIWTKRYRLGIEK